jgi:hypothetical protein
VENGYRLIDSDAHVIEPADMFEKYLEPKFRSALPVAWSEYSGEPLAFRFKLVIPGAGGAEYSMPFGSDPLNDERRARFGEPTERGAPTSRQFAPPQRGQMRLTKSLIRHRSLVEPCEVVRFPRPISIRIPTVSTTA